MELIGGGLKQVYSKRLTPSEKLELELHAIMCLVKRQRENGIEDSAKRIKEINQRILTLNNYTL